VLLWAYACLASGRWADAARGYEFVEQHPSRLGYSSANALSMLGQGRALAGLGQREKARAAYERFFAFWKDADPDVPVLIEAKAEYARLGT
jgi:hypothetical protein